MGLFRGLRLKLSESGIASLNPYRLASAPLRILPQFLIIGTQRGGTSSFFNSLIQHPQVRGSSLKEVHFFDVNYDKGPLWYRSHFPLGSAAGGGTAILTGEASPYYLFHPQAPERVHRLLPDAKLIVLLRNPVDRAVSHYYHMVRLGGESLSLEEALARESQRLAGEAEKIRANPHYHSVSHRRHSYLSRGLYHDQLLDWARHFARDRFLILNSDDFFRSPGPVLKSAGEFLGLEGFSGTQPRRDNAGRYPEVSRATRCKIHEFFEVPNSSLFDFLGVDYGWGP